MQTHPYDVLPLENGAHVIFTPCPGTKAAVLSESITTLKQAGTSMLITLMFDEEMEENNALALPAECEKQAVEWVQLPILDGAMPDKNFESQWQQHKASILAVLHNKGTIAVHCKGGSGRTGLAIALILLAFGWPQQKVIEAVQQLRPTALTSPVHLDYFTSYL